MEAASQDPNIWNDQKKANALFARLRTLRKQWEPTAKAWQDVRDLLELLPLSEPTDLPSLQAQADAIARVWTGLESQLYLGSEFDGNNCYLTLAGGAGGTEAQDWAVMLFRMYTRYCERMGWKTELIEKTDGQEAGIKSATLYVQGDMAYGHLKCERGTHRLVRISPFGAKGLRQTSFALVEVLPEIEETDEIQLNPNELKIDTYRSGGAGGQNVNKVESAIRITHIPTGIVVACQNERSQLQNRQRAMAIMKAKLLERKRQEELSQKSELKGASESADFGQQIRSYVLHPYQMVKDLRNGEETGNTQAVLDGDIQRFIEAELKRVAKGGPDLRNA